MKRIHWLGRMIERTEIGTTSANSAGTKKVSGQKLRKIRRNCKEMKFYINFFFIISSFTACIRYYATVLAESPGAVLPTL
jgi:hypothetical protein